jgi:hypothetical protein
MKTSGFPFNFCAIGFFVSLLFLFFLLGFQYLPFTNAPIINFQVNPEYTNGILTTSSILYGIWGFVFATKPSQKDIDEAEEDGEKVFSTKYRLKLSLYNFQGIIRTVFRIGFFTLVINVVFIVLASCGLFSEGMALIVTAVTFLLNAFFLWLTLDNYVFR